MRKKTLRYGDDHIKQPRKSLRPKVEGRIKYRLGGKSKTLYMEVLVAEEQEDCGN